MTYVDGFIVAVPRAKREDYLRHAAEAFPIFEEMGISRHVEAWASDVPDGTLTDFRSAVQAGEDEDVVFSWFEYASREVRDAVGEKMKVDPRMERMAANMPFDGKRMVYGGFAPLLDVGSAGGAFVDGFVVPVPEANREAYLAVAQKAAAGFERHGVRRIVEAWGDDLPHGKVTDFRRSVKAEEGETVVIAWIEWPDRAGRDAGWAGITQDPDLQPDHANMPFDTRRMFWGGFEVILDKRAHGAEGA